MKNLFQKYLSASAIILIFCVAFAPHAAWSWGGRGHHSLCEAAAYLVKDPNLKKFVSLRPHVMGYLCNTPDIYWKSLKGDARQYGDPSHYLDPEIIGYTVKTLPLDYKKLVADFNGTPSKIDGKVIRFLPNELGSMWWRADQFFRMAVNEKAGLATPAPINRNEEQDENLAFNVSAFKFLVALGLMGHYVGDASQPFHNSADHDGYLSGHGGIHGYYEEAVVSNFDGHLVSKIFRAGQELQREKKSRFLGLKGTPLEKIRALSIVTAEEIPLVLKLDKVSKPSTQKEERGLSIRTPAERKPAEQMSPVFEKMIVRELARGATLLAELWEQAYRDAGSPPLSTYKMYRFPHTQDFVMPDYFDKPNAEKK